MGVLHELAVHGHELVKVFYVDEALVVEPCRNLNIMGAGHLFVY